MDEDLRISRNCGVGGIGSAVESLLVCCLLLHSSSGNNMSRHPSRAEAIGLSQVSDDYRIVPAMFVLKCGIVNLVIAITICIALLYSLVVIKTAEGIVSFAVIYGFFE